MCCCPNPGPPLASAPIPLPCRHSSPNYHHRIDLGTLHHPVLRLSAAVRQIASGKSTVALHYGADNSTHNMMIRCYAVKQQDCFDWVGDNWRLLESHYWLEMRENVFFHPIPSHSPWFIPIPIPDSRFRQVLFPFPSHTHWLFPFSPAPIPVLLVVSRSDNKNKLNNAQNSTVIKEKIQPNPQQYTSSIKASSVSWTSRVKPNLTVYNKLGLLCKNKSGLTVSGDQLPVGGKWENVEFLFPPIPLKSSPFPFPWN